MIFETHAHYEDQQFDADRDALLQSMREHGISRIVNAGSTIETTRNMILFMQQQGCIPARLTV